MTVGAEVYKCQIFHAFRTKIIFESHCNEYCDWETEKDNNLGVNLVQRIWTRSYNSNMVLGRQQKKSTATIIEIVWKTQKNPSHQHDVSEGTVEGRKEQ